MLASLFAFGVLATFAPACSESSDDDTSDDAIVGGEASGTEDDAVVLLVRDGKPLCTATVVAPGVLVTAQHCVGQAQNGRMVRTFEPSEITVRLGGKPGDKAAAVGTKIYTPRAATQTTGGPALTDAGPGATLDGGAATPAASDPRALASMDIAAILVQSLDPSFDKVRPRRLRANGIAETDTVNVVGWSGTGVDARIANLQRMKRSGVDVLADATQLKAVSAPSDDSITTTNKAREFVTESVACQGDDGAPAFDSQGNMAGLVAAVVGPCSQGSLSIFTDIAAQKAFVQGVIAEVGKLACSSDAKCGAAGKICDVGTFTCVEGCRTGSVACAAGSRCASGSSTAGVAGTCTTASGPSTTTDGGVVDPGPDPEDPDSGVVTPPPPTGDGGASAGGCHDNTCGGTTTAPKVCDTKTQQCVAGCRVGASPSMCGVGSECKAGTGADPTIGTCQATNVSAPPPPTLSPPARPTESAAGQEGSGLSPADDNGDGGAKAKAKNKAKDSGGGCSVTPGSHATGTAARGIFIGLGLALATALSRRRRK